MKGTCWGSWRGYFLAAGTRTKVIRSWILRDMSRHLPSATCHRSHRFLYVYDVVTGDVWCHVHLCFSFIHSRRVFQRAAVNVNIDLTTQQSVSSCFYSSTGRLSQLRSRSYSSQWRHHSLRNFCFLSVVFNAEGYFANTSLHWLYHFIQSL